jgi:transposase
MTTMPDSTRPRKGVVGGIDTHADVHVVAVIDELGGLLATASFPADLAGYAQLSDWLSGHGQVVGVGIEGTGSYGAGVSSYLQAQDVTVHEVTRPDRSTRRRVGKSDIIDAEAAARAVLAGRALAIPKSHDGAVEAVRVLRVARRSAVRARTQANNQIGALIGASDDRLRAELRPLPARTRIHTCAAFGPPTVPGDPVATTRNSLGVLARRWQLLDNEIRLLDEQLAIVVPLAAGTLLDVFGVGIDTAGALLVTAGDNPERMHSEAAFAALCGVNPIPASSGKTTRHRLNRGGDRQANSALWRVAMVRLSTHQTTRDYAQRRAEEGRTKPEIIRILKRYIAREIYPHLKAAIDAR